MSPSAVINSISTEWQALSASFVTSFRERFYQYGRVYAIDWLIRPVFDLSIAALIYLKGSTDLGNYVVVAMAANMFLFSTIYYVGEILDRERYKGTLPHLFLAPCRRLSWLAGYALAGIGETLGRIIVILVAGVVLFGISFDANLLTLALALPLYLLTLTGLALVLNGIGLAIKRANAFSNLVSPIFILLGGVYFPVDQMPDGLRQIAQLLPMGYAMEIVTSAALNNASVADVRSEMLILAGFAIVSPIIGILAFGALERHIRRRGEIDLY